MYGPRSIPVAILFLLLCDACCDDVTLSRHGEQLVRMFRDYLHSTERNIRDVSFHNRNSRSNKVLGLASRKSDFKQICSSPGSCNHVVQNFGINFEPFSAMRICQKTYSTDLKFASCVDMSKDCQYLNQTFGICKHQHAVKNLGCVATCTRCDDRCMQGTHDCHAHAACVPEVGGRHSCLCKEGFQGNGKSCTDNDECLGSNTCNRTVHDCINTPGSYRCDCKHGYEKSGDDCLRIYYCNKTDNCSKQAKCHDVIGGFRCVCQDGFSGNGVTCKDIDECKRRSQNLCHQNAQCINTEPGYSCKCKAGYSGDGFTCTDINECLGNPCAPNATCENRSPGYACSCNAPHESRGVPHAAYDKNIGCSLIDVCQGGRNNCSAHAQCIADGYGGFRCVCKVGWTGDGYSCKDIDECERAGICDQNAVCTNTDGSYSCTCHCDYEGPGTSCELKKSNSFYLMFMTNKESSKSNHPEVLMTSKEEVAIKIDTPSNNQSQPRRLLGMTAKPGVTKYELQDWVKVKEKVIENKGIHVQSARSISVFGLNHEKYSSDSVYILPEEDLGKEYIITSSRPYNNRVKLYYSQFGVVSTNANTSVSIKLNTKLGRVRVNKKLLRNGDTYKLKLQYLETFELSHYWDLSGSLITASHKVGVFAGNNCNKVRTGGCSHLVEMLPPIKSLDKIFIVPALYRRRVSTVKVVAHTDTTVSVQMGRYRYSRRLPAQAFYERYMNYRTVAVVKSSAGVLVTHYAHGGRRGDPFMLIVPGMHQYKWQYRFAVPEHKFDSYLTLMVRKSDLKGLRLNGKKMPKPRYRLHTKVDGVVYAVYTYSVRGGAYDVNHVKRERFGAVIYGHALWDGYGYPASLCLGGIPQ